MPRPRKLVGETRDKAQQMLDQGISRTRICQELQVDFHMLRREFGATCTKPKETGRTAAVNAAVLPSILDDDRMGELLSLWSRWMRSNQPLRELWYPDTATGCVGGGYSHDFDTMVADMDTQHAEAVNAAIQDLGPAEQCAIFNVHLGCVFRMRGVAEGVYEEARYTLRVVLPQRGIY